MCFYVKIDKIESIGQIPNKKAIMKAMFYGSLPRMADERRFYVLNVITT